MSNIKKILNRRRLSIRENLLKTEFERDPSKDVWIRQSDGKKFDKLPLERILSGGNVA